MSEVFSRFLRNIGNSKQQLRQMRETVDVQKARDTVLRTATRSAVDSSRELLKKLDRFK
jgi:hypothetical protein